MLSGFEVGKYYKHPSSGEMLHIVSSAKTTIYGWCLVAESSNYIGTTSSLKAVGQGEGHSDFWVESSHEEWINNFSDGDSAEEHF